MKKLVLFPLLLLSLSSFAQEDSTSTMKAGFYMSVIATGATQLSDLNDQLRAAGRVPVTEGLIGVTLGFTSRFADQNSYGATRFSWFSTTDDNPNDDQETQLTVWELAGFGHYDVVANPNWLVYPYLGLGTNFGRLIVSSLETDGSFQNSLDSLGNSEVAQKRYGTDGLMIFGELGGGVERVLKLNGSDVYLGLSGGYRLSTRQPWSLEGVKPFGDPSFGTQGWTFEFKFRVEARPDRIGEVSRGLFRFFQ